MALTFEPPPASMTLTELGASLSAETVCAAAMAIEAIRSADHEAVLVAHHRLAVDGLVTTPFMIQAALVARERGVFAYDSTERAALPWAATWGSAGEDVSGAREDRAASVTGPSGDALFAPECPVARFGLRLSPKAWSKALVETLVGFGWWPGLSEWDLMLMARLREAVAMLHAHWLSELGRADGVGSLPDPVRPSAADGAREAELELEARSPEVRAALLAGDWSRVIADNAVELLNYEAFAYRRGVREGYLVEPDGPYLDLGRAGEYARAHHGRLTSTSFRRWLERCLVPGRDYATSHAEFEARVASALLALLSPTVPSAEGARQRAIRVLQDLGWRVCHAAELAGAPDTAGARSMEAIADGLAALRATEGEAADADVWISRAMATIAAEFGPASGPVDAGSVLALGYAPLGPGATAPDASRTHRAEAVIRRAWQETPVLGTAFEAMRPAVRRLVDAPRQAELVDELRPAAESAAAAGEIYFVAEGYAGWLEVLRMYWGRDAAGRSEGAHWLYRLARRTLPADPATWSEFVVELNPYLQRLPLPFDARWNREALDAPRGEVAAFKPRPPHGVNFCLVGPGRAGPVYLPITPKLNGLLLKLKAPRRLDQLAAMREMSTEQLARAVADEAVLCLHKPHYAQPEVTFNLLERLMEDADALDQRVEPPGPWEEPAQAEAYETFCDRSGLYRDVSTALVEATALQAEARVAELGFGTGETSRVILERLGPLGRLVGADPAPRMVERAYALVPDGRARFVVGAARSLAQVAQFEGPFEALVCNAAIWLSRDIQDELRVARTALERGARLGLSIPAEYLGEHEHLLEPEALAVSAAIERARAATGIAAPSPEEGRAFGADQALGSTSAMRRALEAAGFRDVHFQHYRRPWLAAEYLDWVALPVVISGMCGGRDKERSDELLAALRAEIPAATPLATAWLLITATAA